MTIQVNGIIRAYDPTHDTCTVELTSGGIIDTWLTGVPVHVAVNRGVLANSVPCVLTMPDAHRLCEASITSVWNITNLNTNQTTVTGRGYVTLDSSGGATIAIAYGHTYTTAPTVTATPDQGTIAISGVTTTQFTATLAYGTDYAYGSGIFSWQATGS